MSIYKAIMSHLFSTFVNGVNQNADVLEQLKTDHESHLSDTVPHAELVDRTITVGVGKNFETIQGAINSIKKRVDATITINVDAGTYNENVGIRGFGGGGKLIIAGGTSLETAVNYKVGSFNVTGCTLNIEITGFNVITTTATAFFVTHTNSVGFKYCLSTVSATAFAGFVFRYSNVMCLFCQISNRNYALNAGYNSSVYSFDWTVGSGNTIGLSVEASVIMKNGPQPQGTTAESVKSGGVIR